MLNTLSALKSPNETLNYFGLSQNDGIRPVVFCKHIILLAEGWGRDIMKVNQEVQCSPMKQEGWIR